MLLAAFYAGVFLAATSAWMWVQFGWQPPFAAVWDSRAYFYFGMLCASSAWVAAVGTVDQTPWRRLPKFLRAIPFTIVSFVTLFAFLFINDLSAASTTHDVLSKLGLATAAGVGAGIVIGFLDALAPEPDAERKDAQNPENRRIRILLVLAAIVSVGVTSLLIPRARDDAGIRDFARFGNAQGCLEIGVSKGAMTDDQFGIVKITAQGKANGLVLERDEWSAVSELWSKAEHAQSGNWRVVGEVHDTQTSDPSRLVLTAGKQGVRFVISSPHDQTMTFDLAPGNFSRFDAAVAKVAITLHQ
ncbi:MAG: hypothetical protein ABSA49_02205 [Rhizomicrobium sp.]|jgi:hypothetical protein